jgi:hypothetical protein
VLNRVLPQVYKTTTTYFLIIQRRFNDCDCVILCKPCFFFGLGLPCMTCEYARKRSLTRAEVVEITNLIIFSVGLGRLSRCRAPRGVIEQDHMLLGSSKGRCSS